MHLRFGIGFLCSLALTCSAGAQTFSPERIRADVGFLADDLLEGRAGSGTAVTKGTSWYQPWEPAGVRPSAS